MSCACVMILLLTRLIPSTAVSSGRRRLCYCAASTCRKTRKVSLLLSEVQPRYGDAGLGLVLHHISSQVVGDKSVADLSLCHSPGTKAEEEQGVEDGDYARHGTRAVSYRGRGKGVRLRQTSFTHHSKRGKSSTWTQANHSIKSVV